MTRSYMPPHRTATAVRQPTEVRATRSKITARNRHEETEWGPRAGKEAL